MGILYRFILKDPCCSEFATPNLNATGFLTRLSWKTPLHRSSAFVTRMPEVRVCDARLMVVNRRKPVVGGFESLPSGLSLQTH